MERKAIRAEKKILKGFKGISTQKTPWMIDSGRELENVILDFVCILCVFGEELRFQREGWIPTLGQFH
jgi:hypothetical protein